ncbi:hypothetical protein ACOJUR_09915 [Alicyclobacillus tolerans]
MREFGLKIWQACGGKRLTFYAFLSDQSRKSKMARYLFDDLWYNSTPQQRLSVSSVEGYNVFQGISLSVDDRQKVLNLHLKDEYLSPYLKTNMNLFHLLMMDEQADIKFFKLENGWLFEFDGIPAGPKPFGQQKYDTR